MVRADNSLEHNGLGDADGTETSRPKPYQVDSLLHRPIHQCFEELLPRRPYCSNEPRHGLKIRDRRTALKHSHVQVNSPLDVRWLCFDVDRTEAAFAWEESGLPAPNAVAANPANGHAHLLWCLGQPVHAGFSSRASPLRFVADVENGMLRRLGADPGYSGLIVKNPISPCWRVTWPAPFPYGLRQLNTELNREDKMRSPKASESIGLGRNCVLFDALRRRAYREVLKAKSEGLSPTDFQIRLEALGHELNQSEWPLARARWQWERYAPLRARWRASRIATLRPIDFRRCRAIALKLAPGAI